MLSYQHGFHAGGFADVIKHSILVYILNYLIQKSKPIFYLDTHAGRGLYSLKNAQAIKTLEYSQGIGLLWERQKQLSEFFTPYLKIINHLNPKKLICYPGSPYLALQILRPCDRIITCELHPQEFHQLTALAKDNKNFHCQAEDGIQQLKALLPPIERRGLIFIDPSYELKSDYRQINLALLQAIQRFANGIFCLWYPLLNANYHQRLTKNLPKLTKYLTIELLVYPPKDNKMLGCGLFIINPPFTLSILLQSVCEQLTKIFNPGYSVFKIQNNL